MSSWSDTLPRADAPAPVRRTTAASTAPSAADLPTLPTPELRRGEWTRHGGTAVLGDQVTESLLGALATDTREAARAQGYAVGWAEGRRAADARAAEEARLVADERAAADARRAAEHQAAMSALADAADGVRRTLEGLSDALAAQGTDLAWTLIEELLQHQIRYEDGPDVIRRVLGALPAVATATVRLHPDVVATPAAGDLADRGVIVVSDPHLDRSDAMVETDGTIVDLRIGQARDRVRLALGIEAS